MSEERASDLYCPICGHDLAYIWVWREPESDRIRIFCDDCARLPEYHDLPKPQRQLLNAEGFGRFTARRMLSHVFEKELEAQSRLMGACGSRCLCVSF